MPPHDPEASALLCAILLCSRAPSLLFLKLLLQAIRQPPPQSEIHLHTAAASSLLQPGGRVTTLQRSHMLWGMLKVAALDAADLRWSHSTALPEQPAAADEAASALPFKDVFGPCLAAGTYLTPRLLAAGAAGAAPATLPPAEQGAVVITGGMGALGTLLAAQQLCNGSSNGIHPYVVLLGRTVDTTALEAALGSAWRQAGRGSRAAVLSVVKCDSSAADDVAGLAHAMHLSGTRIHTLVHAAGVLKVSAAALQVAADKCTVCLPSALAPPFIMHAATSYCTRGTIFLLQDALMPNQTAGSLRAAIAPKSAAAAHLSSRLGTAGAIGRLQLFSSIASLLGSGGQGNYAAANALLDSLAAGWQQQGICAASIAWGAWGGTGMAAADGAVAARLHRVGIAAIQPEAGLAALEKAVCLSVAAGSGTMMAAGLVWERLLVGGRQHKPFFAEFAADAAIAVQQQAVAAMPGAAPSAAASGGSSGRMQRRSAPADAVLQPLASESNLPAWHYLAPAERVVFFSDEISALVARAAGKAVGLDEPLLSAGLDSLGKKFLLVLCCP